MLLTNAGGKEKEYLTDKCRGQRESMLLTNAGAKEKEYVTDKCRGQRERVCYSVGQRADMNILRGGAQPKKSESLSQVFSHLQRTSSVLIDMFYTLLVV